MFLIDGRIFLFIMETAHSGVLSAGDADAGRCGALCGTFACFALIRRLRRHLPPRRGRLLRWNDFSMFYLLTFHQIGAVSIFYGTTVVAFPFEGEGGAKRRMRADGRCYFYPLWEGFLGSAVLHVIPLSKRDPACWRPAWGGVRLRGNGWWERVIFGEWCRFAQDDTGVRRNVVRNLLGTKDSSIKLTDTAFCSLSHAPVSHVSS